MTILPPPSLSLYLSHDWERLARGNSRATRRGVSIRCMTDNSGRDVSCYSSSLLRMGKLLQREETSATPKQKRIDPHRLEDWKICCIMQHRWGGASPSDRAQSAQHISTTDTISPPPTAHHVNRMNESRARELHDENPMNNQNVADLLDVELLMGARGQINCSPSNISVDEWWDWWPCKKIFVLYRIPLFLFFFLSFPPVSSYYWSKAKRTWRASPGDV